MSGVRKPVMKSNVLPFPSLMPAPKDPPRPKLWKSFVTTVVVVGGAMFLAYLVLSLCLP